MFRFGNYHSATQSPNFAQPMPSSPNAESFCAAASCKEVQPVRPAWLGIRRAKGLIMLLHLVYPVTRPFPTPWPDAISSACVISCAMKPNAVRYLGVRGEGFTKGLKVLAHDEDTHRWKMKHESNQCINYVAYSPSQLSSTSSNIHISSETSTYSNLNINS